MTRIKKLDFLKITNAQDLAVYDFDSFIPQEYISFPLAELSSLGVAFSALPNAFINVLPAAQKTKTLYEATFPVAGHLAKAKDGSGLLGTILNEKGIAAQARFKEVRVDDVANIASNTGTMFIALALMAINKSVKEIAETQKSIITFLEINKQSQLKGDFILLSDIISEYQYNWDNEQYLKNRETQVLDIKRSAEQNIIFYKEIINNYLDKKAFIHIDTSKKLSEIYSKLAYLKMSIYQYSFSTFLDVVLLGNYDTKYLESVIDKIKDYSLQYYDFYNDSIDKIEKYVKSSLQARALKGVSIAGGFLGEQIAKIPDKDNKIKIDDSLIAGSKKVNEFNDKSIKDSVDAFTALADSGINVFTDKIKLFDDLYNKPLKLLFDSDNIYLPNNNS